MVNIKRHNNRNNSKTRDQKVANGEQRIIKEKYADEHHNHVNQFKPNPEQQIVQRMIRENRIVFVEGNAGVGKSSCILHEFCKTYLKDNTKEIVIIRTPLESGMDKIGALPNSLTEKIEPHFVGTKKILEQLIGKGKVDADVGKRIHFEIPNYIIGRSLDNSLILIDEAQTLPPMILKLLLERIGRNSICVVTGDPSQLYVTDKKRNGLTDAVNRFTIGREGIVYPRYEGIEYYRFSNDYNMRDDIVKTVIKAYSDL